MNDEIELLTLKEAAEYLRMPSGAALQAFRRRNGFPRAVKMGRRVLFAKTDLNDAIARWAERRASIRVVR